LSLAHRVIIVGPPELSGALARRAEVDAVHFRTLEELDRWREQRQDADEAIGADMIAALDELGMAIDELPPKLRTLLEAIATETHVPTLRDLEHRWTSRRSFYRLWNEAFDEPPSMFLRRVRSLHALRLLALGFTKKEAALLAGYSSVDQMRRNINSTSVPHRRPS
jgi:hypothetical protein